MGQDEELGQVIAERAYRFSEALLSSFLEVVGLGVASDQESQADVRKGGAKARLPARRALAARRKIRAVHRSRIAEAGRHDGDASSVVEACAIEPQPLAQ